jgi:hypothetical protein
MESLPEYMELKNQKNVKEYCAFKKIFTFGCYLLRKSATDSSFYETSCLHFMFVFKRFDHFTFGQSD